MPEVSIGEVLVILAIIGVYAAIAAGILYLAVRFVGGRRDGSRRVLRDRLANGEITPREYEEAERILGRS